MPYIYSLAGMTWFKDYTIMRPLVMDFTADANVNNIGDQFMFGPAFMVSPVYRYGDRSREVYFPKSEGWYDFYTGKYQKGGVKARWRHLMNAFRYMCVQVLSCRSARHPIYGREAG